MAALLPPAYRGVYSDLNAATEKYLTVQPNHRWRTSSKNS